MGEVEHWYSPRGRIGRQTWLLRFLGVLVVFFAPMLLPNLAFGGDPPEDVREVAGLTLLLTMPVCLVFRLLQDIKRLHDLGQSGWLVLCAVVPVVNFFYMVVLALQDGEPRRNAYGPDLKRRDESAEAVAAVFR